MRGSARALAASLSAAALEDLVIAARHAGARPRPSGRGPAWLPHTQVPGVADGAGSRRLITTNPVELEDLLGSRLEGRPRFHSRWRPVPEQPRTLVVVLDGVPPAAHLDPGQPRGPQGVIGPGGRPGDLAAGRAATSPSW
ncbi:hypothetical protein [Streptomyces sp. KL116D]|uniref:hypothetical protein n=1 Tax=Streptomyces sp. KL116D TaxID=3045152 RepID=UPI0035560A12